MNPLRRSHRRSHRLRRFIRRRTDAVVYHLTRFALWLPRKISLARALAIADYVGDLLYYAMRGTRRLALEHLAIALGDELSTSARKHIARAAFRNHARIVVEFAKFDDIRPRFDEYVSIEGWEHWDEVRALGRGGIVITGHIGNWDLLGAYVARKGIPIAAAARHVNNSRLNQLLMDFRARNGVRPILRKSRRSSWEILRILKQGGILALLIDRDIRKTPSVSVPFFGRLARTPVAAAFLAVRRDLPVIPAFAQRRAEGGHHFTIMAPIYPPKTGDRQRDILELTHQFSQILEHRIRQNPGEWVWWHRRWRRRPVPRFDLDRLA
jgi:KDO2-lipid IV(A) lauroyltransferase